MSPLIVALGIAGVASLFVWIASLVTRDTSWVDRLWSIVPVVYVWVFAIAAGMRDPRLDAMAVLVLLWGVRLTFNFARKGGYAGVGGDHEDYRWAVLRGRMNPVLFQVFNLLFIVIYQNAVLFLIASPAWTAFEHRGSFGPLDVVLIVLFLAFLAGETTADQQQWRFHQGKKAESAAGREPFPRFLQRGLFRVSRHPNFFFENAQWWVIALFGVVAARGLDWTDLGIVLLLSIFIGSVSFTEQITRSKYPEYAEYQRRTSPVIPWFPRRVRAEAEQAAG